MITMLSGYPCKVLKGLFIGSKFSLVCAYRLNITHLALGLQQVLRNCPSHTATELKLFASHLCIRELVFTVAGSLQSSADIQLLPVRLCQHAVTPCPDSDFMICKSRFKFRISANSRFLSSWWHPVNSDHTHIHVLTFFFCDGCV